MNFCPVHTHRAAKPQSLHAARGFTLIELMIAVAVVGILSAIAYPSYTQYVVRSYRVAAQAKMMDAANRQQQFFIANRVYATQLQLIGSGFGLDADLANRYNYSIALGTDAIPSYTITFTPKNNQTSDVELKLDSTGVKTPISKWN
jgi:type IV pilus assembly protein PilE